MTTGSKWLLMVSHLLIGGGVGWPLWQSHQREAGALETLHAERATLQTRLRDLPSMEAKFGSGLEAAQTGRLLEEGERFHRLATALTEWSDLAEVEVTGIRSVENSEHHLVLEADVKGSSAGVIQWVEFAERAQPPLALTQLVIRRVATHVVASVTLETVPALHFQSPPNPKSPLSSPDPFRKDP